MFAYLLSLLLLPQYFARHTEVLAASRKEMMADASPLLDAACRLM